MPTAVNELIGHWLQQSKRRGSENVDNVITTLEESADAGAPVPFVTLICPNFEIRKKWGSRPEVMIHDSFVHDERGNLRRGYVAIEEMAAVHEAIGALGISVQHSLFIIDNAIQWQPKGSDHAIQQGTEILQRLADIRLEDRGVSKETMRVRRLSAVLPAMDRECGVDFDEHWELTSQAIWGVLERPNHSVAGLIRREVKKETRYLMDVWGVKSETEAKESLIRDQYALTATIGRLLPQLHAAAWGEQPTSRDRMILLDSILGPKEDTHNAEYALYNMPFDELDKDLPSGDGSPLGVLRVVANVALWSDRAVPTPLSGKSMHLLEDEAQRITEKGIIPD